MPKKPKRKPLGGMLPRTDEDLERLAQIQPEDVEDARLWMQKHAPEPFRDIIEAKPEDDNT